MRTRFLCALMVFYICTQNWTVNRQYESVRDGDNPYTLYRPSLRPQLQDSLLSMVSLSIHPPRHWPVKSRLLRATALLALLLLCGDIETNPGPPCTTCGGQILQIRERTVCEGCNKPLHTHCSFQIPENNSTNCKSCFWREVSLHVAKNTTPASTTPCKCLAELQALRKQIDDLTRKILGKSSTALTTLKTADHRSNQPTINRYQPKQQQQQQNVQLRSKRDVPTPRRLRFNSSQHYNVVGTPNEVHTPHNPPWHTVGKGGRKMHVTTGTNKMTQLRAVEAHSVPDRPRVKALFVSRVELSHSADAIKEYVCRIIGADTEVKVTKLAGMNQEYYNSYHVQVAANKFNELLDPSVWPDGIHFRPYRGQLHQYRVSSAVHEVGASIGAKRYRASVEEDHSENKEMETNQ